MASDNCLFCGIVKGEVPADVLLRTEKSVAFGDINPQAPVHFLVIPATHIDNAGTVEAADSEAVCDLLTTAQRVAQDHGIAETGYRLVFNVGQDACNTVAHLHLHVLGGRGMTWPPG